MVPNSGNIALYLGHSKQSTKGLISEDNGSAWQVFETIADAERCFYDLKNDGILKTDKFYLV